MTKSKNTGGKSNISCSSFLSDANVIKMTPEPMPLLKKVTGIKPKVTYTKVFDYNENIKSIYYTGLDYLNRPTRVFAYIGFPAIASSDNKVPAVVCVHGGGGNAFPQWVEEWNKRGYAAIAMDTYGNMPSLENGKMTFIRDEQGAAPPECPFGTIDQPICNHWMFHAVADTILANNILRADNRVLPDKIGLTGISWGGIITGITIGVDNRFAFAIPVYGCGYLNHSKTYFKEYKNKKIAEFWGVENYIPFIEAPVFWLSGDSDPCFDILCFAKTVINTKEATCTIKPSMIHSHNHGWESEEIYRFADSISKDKKPDVKIITQPNKYMGKNVNLNVEISNEIEIPIVRAYYMTEPLVYIKGQIGPRSQLKGNWEFVDGTYKDATISIQLPDEVYCYYVNVIASIINTKQHLIYSTNIVLLN